MQRLQRRGLDIYIQRLGRCGHFQPPRGLRQRGALYQSVDHDDDEHDVEQADGAGHAGVHRDGGQHDRDRAAQPGPGQERLLPPGHPQRQRADEHRGGPGHQHQRRARGYGRDDLRGQPGWGGEQPEHDEQADLGEPGDAFGEAADGRAVREPGVAQDKRGHVNGEEAAGAGQRRRPVAGDDERQDRDRVQARGRQRDTAQGQRAGRSREQPDRGPGSQLPGDLAGDQRGRGRVAADVAEQGHREHRGRVVEPGLPSQLSPHLPPQAQSAVDTSLPGQRSPAGRSAPAPWRLPGSEPGHPGVAGHMGAARSGVRRPGQRVWRGKPPEHPCPRARMAAGRAAAVRAPSG